MNDQIKTDKFHRAIDCDECPSNGPKTQLQAWITQDGLDRLEAESIDFVDDDDVRRLAGYGEGGVEGHCEPCNGADDGDDGNQDG